jgi:hypothetical protein
MKIDIAKKILVAANNAMFLLVSKNIDTLSLCSVPDISVPAVVNVMSNLPQILRLHHYNPDTAYQNASALNNSGA